MREEGPFHINPEAAWATKGVATKIAAAFPVLHGANYSESNPRACFIGMNRKEGIHSGRG